MMNSYVKITEVCDTIRVYVHVHMYIYMHTHMHMGARGD
jgi:hypothetical protein